MSLIDTCVTLALAVVGVLILISIPEMLQKRCGRGRDGIDIFTRYKSAYRNDRPIQMEIRHLCELNVSHSLLYFVYESKFESPFIGALWPVWKNDNNLRGASRTHFTFQPASAPFSDRVSYFATSSRSLDWYRFFPRMDPIFWWLYNGRCWDGWMAHLPPCSLFGNQTYDEIASQRRQFACS